MGDALIIRTATIADAAAIAAIYAPYVRDGAITFETDPPEPAAMAARISRLLPTHPWLVAERDGTIAGYAYADRLYERPAYRWSAEATVYVALDARGLGIGPALYGALIEALRGLGFQAVFGKITLPNAPSVHLHERFGFVRCGLLSKVGFKHGEWHDVGLYQLDLATRPDAPAGPLPNR